MKAGKPVSGYAYPPSRHLGHRQPRGLEHDLAYQALATGAIAAALERDVLLITCGFHDQVVRFIPALNIGEADLRKGMRTFVEAARSAQVASPA